MLHDFLCDFERVFLVLGHNLTQFSIQRVSFAVCVWMIASLAFCMSCSILLRQLLLLQCLWHNDFETWRSYDSWMATIHQQTQRLQGSCVQIFVCRYIQAKGESNICHVSTLSESRYLDVYYEFMCLCLLACLYMHRSITSRSQV